MGGRARYTTVASRCQALCKLGPSTRLPPPPPPRSTCHPPHSPPWATTAAAPPHKASFTLTAAKLDFTDPLDAKLLGVYLYVGVSALPADQSTHSSCQGSPGAAFPNYSLDPGVAAACRPMSAHRRPTHAAAADNPASWGQVPSAKSIYGSSFAWASQLVKGAALPQDYPLLLVGERAKDQVGGRWRARLRC